MFFGFFFRSIFAHQLCHYDAHRLTCEIINIQGGVIIIDFFMAANLTRMDLE